jgi:general secretion pathway protein J
MSDARGFTLIELLIALALTGLVALLLVDGTRFAAQGTNRVAAAADRLEARHTLDDLLRHDLSASIASPLLPNAAPLIGGPQKIEFLSVAEDSGTGLYRIRLDVETDGLALTRTPIAGGVPERTLLAPPPTAFALAYFGSPDRNEAAAWHERWDSAIGPPSLVRVTLDAERPPLVVRLWEGR